MINALTQFFKKLFGGRSNVRFHVIDVRVTPQAAVPDAGEVLCDINPIGHVGGGTVQNNSIALNATEGPFCIRFHLDNRLNWDGGDPFWVQRDNCPNASSSVPDQIWVDRNPRNRVLTIMNMNVGNRCQLHYRLNFTNGRFCDPIMENGGGNIFG